MRTGVQWEARRARVEPTTYSLKVSGWRWRRPDQRDAQPPGSRQSPTWGEQTVRTEAEKGDLFLS